MKNFGKLMAAVLVIAAIMMTMCVPAMAETKFDATDAAEVQITNLKAGVTVKLYQIVDAEYDETGFKGYNAVTGVTIADPIAPTYAEVTAIANGLNAGTITLGTPVEMTLEGTTAKATVTAGTWLAVVTGGGETIYNPMVVSAYYADATGTPITGGTTDATAGITLEGGAAVAKSSTPTIEKKVDGADSSSASVGDKVNYTITAEKPSYPANAVNKTFYVKDTMSTGLTLDPASIAVKGATRDGNIFKVGDKVIANLKVEGNTFTLAFVYDNLTADPKVTYSAVINDDAVVGGNGNTNDVKLVYANDPTKGETWDNPNDPDHPKEPEPGDQTGLTETNDSTTVYTYQLAFKKTGSGDDSEKLAGAQFGIYSDEGCTKLIDIVTTNAEGYAVSSKVGEGTYYIKELAAPAGYSLNTTVYPITATKTAATSTATVTKREYTTKLAEAVNDTQVGWLLDGVFYKDEPAGGKAQAAYLESETTTTSSVTEQGEGAGTVLLDKDIPNTKVSELPSTGGMGTTLFVVGGIAVMALAIALIAANKRRTSESK